MYDVKPSNLTLFPVFVKVMKGLKWGNSQILVSAVAAFIFVKHPANKLFLGFLPLSGYSALKSSN